MQAIQLIGAGLFGLIIGWYVYYVNRYRKGGVQFSDITTLIGVIGGGSVLSLFNNDKTMFGAYGIGLFIGFFAYFTALNIYVRISENFNSDWFLDGRRKRPEEPWYIPDDVTPSPRPMDSQPGIHGRHPSADQPLASPLVTINTAAPVQVQHVQKPPKQQDADEKSDQENE